MATDVLDATKIWLAGYDVSGDIKGVNVVASAELLDDTTFGDTTRSRKGGLHDVAFSAAGFWNAAASPAGIDDILWARVGVADVPVSVAPLTGAGGETAYTFRANIGEYVPGGEIGQLLAFTVSAQASGGSGLVRGTVLFNAIGQTASGNGTKFTVGAVSATQRMYAALHVLGAGTGTFDAILQSDADGSAGGETNRITFAQASGITSEWKSVAGPITDTLWRLNYTIAGGAPSFDVVLVAGIR